MIVCGNFIPVHGGQTADVHFVDTDILQASARPEDQQFLKDLHLAIAAEKKNDYHQIDFDAWFNCDRSCYVQPPCHVDVAVLVWW